MACSGTRSRMTVFRDAFSGDSLFQSKEEVVVEGIMYRVEGKYITGIEDNSGDMEDARTFINVVSACKLRPRFITPHQFKLWLKRYINMVCDRLSKVNPERIKEFKCGAAFWAKKVLTDFRSFDFFLGKSLSPDGQIILMHSGDDGLSPTFYFWCDGLLSHTKMIKL